MNGPTPDFPLIVLTTDFGVADAFVGVMKGVILGINPRATIVDLTHELQPQDVRQGALVLGQNYPYFPAGAIHVAVVDPGVGTDRRAVLVETPEARFIAPDNGLLSEVVKKYLDVRRFQGGNPDRVNLEPALQAYELTNPRFRLHPVSSTFHGRDVFAPAAAYLSLGVSPGELGSRVSQLVYRPLPEPVVQMNQVEGEVVYIDKFGNLITNVTSDDLGAAGLKGPTMLVVIGGRRIFGLSRTFHDSSNGGLPQPDGLPLVALMGSNGYLEVALRDGNAARALEVETGDPVTLSLGA